MKSNPATGRHEIHGEAVYGVRPELVLGALKERILNPQATDGRKIALVLEGGGMRGASPAGGALALGHMGFAEAFDDVYATSAAVMNASYFLTRQEDMGISVYFDDLTGKRFCNPARAWKILDVDYVINEVVGRIKPLDLDRLLKHRSNLHVSLMDRITGRGHLINLKECSEPPLKVLNAALAIPVFYNRSLSIEGKSCVDGGLVIPFPIEQAIADGCTDILVLLSHPADHEPKAAAIWQQAVFKALFSGIHAGPLAAYRNHHAVSQKCRDLALGRLLAKQDVNIATLCPSSKPYLKTMTLSRDLLIGSANHFGKKTIRVFGLESMDWNLGPSSMIRSDFKSV